MLEHLTTEASNERSSHLDRMNAFEFVTLMNEEDQKVALAIQGILPQIAEVIEMMGKAYRAGGRVIYFGAGTSGRLGVLDAVECVPTFGVGFDEVIGLIAGGEQAFVKAVEGAEDQAQLGEQDLAGVSLRQDDVVIGIAASGRTPYVIGGLAYANERGANTVALACNVDSEIGKLAKYKLEVNVGAELLTGSTRLKAGTAQKMILNMLSTGAMVQAGKVYGNLMVDVQLTNEKLVERAKRMIMMATSVDYSTAEKYLLAAHHRPKLAIVMLLAACDYTEAVARLDAAEGFVAKAVDLTL